MKAISLHQPWASFIAIGVKPFETRDWSRPRGLVGQRIAIHAAKKPIDADNREWARRVGVEGELPLGAVVCTVLLIGAYQCGPALRRGLVKIAQRIEMSEISHIDPGGIPADEFGDYHEGRWAWRMTDVERLDPPVPASGRQKFWEWVPG